MSDVTLALVLSLAILLSLFLWVPTLDLCDEYCQKFLRGRMLRRQAGEHAEQLVEREKVG